MLYTHYKDTLHRTRNASRHVFEFIPSRVSNAQLIHTLSLYTYKLHRNKLD